jgi:hypothetical protein
MSEGTPLIKAFSEFRNAFHRAVMTDCEPHVSDARLTKAWQAAEKAEADFLAMLAAAPEPPSPSPELREALEALAQCGGLIEGMIETHAIKSDVATAVVDRARSILDKYPQD